MKNLLFCLALCGCLALSAQNYPITAIVQVSQFSPQLEAYDDPGRVIITLLSTDDRPEYQALMRINLSGPGFSLRSNPNIISLPIRLQRNLPLVLTGAQLREYFSPQNLLFAGQSLTNLQAGGGLLPEGPVSLCVELYDFNRFNDPPVSNTGCALGYLLLHRPPVLIAPIGDVGYTFPQQLLFQWQAQHAGIAVRYTLEVYEHNLPGMADNLVISSSQPLIKTTALTPFYWATQAAPLFRPNIRYLVRIKAEDISGQSAFLNGGWSDVYAFYLRGDGPFDEPPSGANCKPPALQLAALDARAALLAWDTDDEPVELRYKPLAATSWATAEPGIFRIFRAADYGLPPNQAAELAPLNTQSTYLAQLRLQCTDSLWSDWSEPLLFCLDCELADSLHLVEATASTATIQGPPQANALKYHFEYRPAGAQAWIPAPPTDQPLLTLTTALQPNTRYEARMRYWCNRGVWSNYTPTLSWLSPAQCPPPLYAAANPIGTTHARLHWQPTPGSDRTRLRYREKRTILAPQTWQTAESDTSFVRLIQLSAGAVYQYQLQAECGTLSSPWTPTAEFSLQCAPPTQVQVAALLPDSAQLSWVSANGRGQSYQLVYRRRTDTQWSDQSAASPQALLTALQPYTHYELAVACRCASGQLSAFSDTLTFRTPARCLSPRELEATDIQVRSARAQWQAVSAMNAWEVVLEQRGANPASQVRGEDSDGGPPQDPFAGWQRYTTPEETQALTALKPDTPYRLAVRGRCPDDSWTPYSAPVNFRTLADCQPPDSLGVTERYATRARLHWRAANAFDDEYLAQLERVPAVAPVGQGMSDSRSGGHYADSLRATTPEATFENLESYTEYRFRVKTRCDNFGWTPYSEWYYFRTDECAPPIGIVKEPISNSTMRLRWTPREPPNTYEIKYRLAADPDAIWQYVTTTEAQVELNPLLINQVYDYQIAEVCQGGVGILSAPPDTFLMKRARLLTGIYTCGLEPSVDLSNQSPLPELLVGDTILAFDFWVAITEVSGSGGYFTGTGNIDIPFFKKARFELAFDNIFVNDEYRMVGGYMEVTGAGVEVLPPWADSLLLAAMGVLQLVDVVLQDEQLSLMDSLMNCCSEYLPDALQDEIQDVLDCYAQQDQLPEPNYTYCEALLDSLMAHLNDQLDSVVAAMDTLIVESMTLDILRMAMDQLSTEHSAALPPAYNNYAAARDVFNTSYPPLPASPAAPPNYEADWTDPPTGEGNGSSVLQQLSENTLVLKENALSLVTEDLFTTGSGALPSKNELKTFALTLRSGDVDVYTPIHTQVQALWDQHGAPTFDIAPLLTQAKALFVQKVNFLVHQ